MGRVDTTNSMRTLLCVEPGRLKLVSRPWPEEQPGRTRVRLSRIGICGTDYHIFEGSHPYLSYPRVMGHELSGHAMEASRDGRIAAGDLVVINPYLSCGTCRACRADKPNCCENIKVLGVHTDGGMCEQISVPDENLYPAVGLSETGAAMVEFLAIGAHGVRRSGIGREASAMVVGAGPIGIGCAFFAAVAGAEVTLCDTSPARLELAGKILPQVRLVDAASRGDEAFDAVFDATGNLDSMNAGLNWVAHGGSYVLLSLVKGEIRFSDPEFHKRETTLYASRNAVEADFRHVMDTMRAGLVPVDLLATHETSLEDAVQDMPRWVENRGALVKAIIHV